MSTRTPSSRGQRQAGSGKSERYIQPSILLGLRRKPSYGYEIIQTIQEYGFVEGQAPPGMIYRHLRDLEAAGLVTSSWKTESTGPAKRVYELTPEGGEALALWAEYMEQQARKLMGFIKAYRKTI
ncbi:MAG: helix-turn-helix transcriptional regulator [Deltaproteobacteria bacterium]|nr:helix-turn-helix transcriptional regulator [Deltaproteobacteria bacterium]